VAIRLSEEEIVMRSYPAGSLRLGLHRRLVPVLSLSLITAALGCRDDALSPSSTEEVATPALATAAAAPLVFRVVSSGDGFTCGVTTDDRAYCWGNNFTGQLGDGTRTYRTRPVAVTGGLHFKNVNVGTDHSCGVTTDNRPYCWGYGNGGKLGDGTNSTITPHPVRVFGGYSFRQIRAGPNHTCGITTSGLGFCWGSNAYGQLGNFSHKNALTPARVGGGLHWRWLSPGAYHTCGVTTDDRAFCWGRNAEGQLGNGGGVAQSRPVAVVGGLLFEQIESGHFHTCAVTTTNRAYCWGSNWSAELGIGTSGLYRLTPVAVAGGLRFKQVSAAQSHSCGVTTVGRGFCWGSNPRGELGDGTTTSRLKPTALGIDLTLAMLSSGEDHGCAVTTVGQAYCWGENRVGALGDGTQTRRLLPVPVAAP
jgi:alpha-tubulin suppressor-like RCC1 family protein